jgi:DNA-directed RNA polymerase subunit beta'
VVCPRLLTSFEARKPKDHAIVSEIEGRVVFEKDVRGRKVLTIQPEVGEPIEYQIPKGKHIVVREGDYIKPGDALIEGTPNPHDILKVQGVKGVARFLVEEIQQVYRAQGVKINDKHFEVIVKQMLKKVKIKEAGDTDFMVGKFEEVNEKVLAQGGRPAQAEPMIMGITKVALLTDSWLSAASFQETTRVLTEAAIAGKVDYLRGLKENVIVGRLIPAGTGGIVYEEKGWL